MASSFIILLKILISLIVLICVISKWRWVGYNIKYHIRSTKWKTNKHGKACLIFCKMLIFFSIIYLVCVCLCVCMHTFLCVYACMQKGMQIYILQYACGIQRATCKIWWVISVMWVLRLELRQWGKNLYPLNHVINPEIIF